MLLERCHMSLLAFLGLNQIGPIEGLALLALGLLLFGKRLPEVGRGLGKGIVEFRRGLKGISDEVEEQANRSAATPAPRAELPTSAPAAPQSTVLNQPPAEEARVSRNDKFE